MAANKATVSDGKQSIEQLQRRHEQLNTQKIQAQTKLESARQQLEALKREAREKYGTDDLAVLRQKLADMKDENERKRADYQAELDRIETDLAAVEERFAVAEQRENTAS